VTVVASPAGTETTALLRSIRRWLLVLVALVGILLVALSAVGYEVSGATDGALYAAVGLVGGLTALVATLRALVALFGRAAPDTADGSTDAE
jgi:hypothetical protein